MTYESQYSSRTDAELLELVVEKQDRLAMKVLIEKHSRLLMSVCWQTLQNQNDAEDAFQTTIVHFVKNAATIQKPKYVSTWLYRVAQRESVNILRRKKRDSVHSIEEHSDVVVNKEEFTREQYEELSSLHEELNGLPDKYRGPLVLCYLEGKSREEAARELEVSLSSIKAALATGRKHLQRRLLKRGFAFSSVVAVWQASQAHAEMLIPTEMVQQAIQTGVVQLPSVTTTGAVSATGTSTVLTKGTSWMAASLGKKLVIGLVGSIVLLSGTVGFLGILLNQVPDQVEASEPDREVKKLIAKIKEQESFYQNTDMTVHITAQNSFSKNLEPNRSREIVQDVHQKIHRVNQAPKYLVEFDQEVMNQVTEFSEDGQTKILNPKSKTKHQAKAFDGISRTYHNATTDDTILNIDPNPFQVVLGSTYLGRLSFSELLHGGQYTTKLLQKHSGIPFPDNIEFHTHFVEKTELDGEPVVVVEFNSYEVNGKKKKLIKKHRIHLAINKNYIPMRWEGGITDDAPPTVDYKVLSWSEEKEVQWFPQTAVQKTTGQISQTISYSYEINQLNPDYPQEFFRVEEKE